MSTRFTEYQSADYSPATTQPIQISIKVAPEAGTFSSPYSKTRKSSSKSSCKIWYNTPCPAFCSIGCSCSSATSFAKCTISDNAASLAESTIYDVETFSTEWNRQWNSQWTPKSRCFTKSIRHDSSSFGESTSFEWVPSASNASYAIRIGILRSWHIG